MAVSRVQTSSILQGFPKSRSLLAGNSAYSPYSPSSFESIQTVTLGGTQSSISFTSIPSTYKHLQIRYLLRGTNAGLGVYARFNSDSGSNYANHYLTGDGSSASSGAYLSETRFIFGAGAGTALGTGIFAVAILDILDYKSTVKYKTGRALSGVDANGSGNVSLNSSLWLNTNAISNIEIFPTAGSFAQYSSFALYGIK